MSLIDDVLAPVITPPGAPQTPPPPEKFFAQLFSGGQLPDLGPVSAFADGARTFLSNVPHDNALAAVLNVVQRPNFAVASATEKALRGGNPQEVLGAFGGGLVGQTQTTFGDVLKQQGVPEGPSLGPVSLRDVAGTALDIATDPLTYLTFGGAGAGKFGATKLAVPFTGIEKTVLPFDALSTVAHAADMATNLVPKVPELKTALRDTLGQVFESNYALKKAGFGDVAEGLQTLARAPSVIKGETLDLLANKLAPLESAAQKQMFFRAADSGFDMLGQLPAGASGPVPSGAVAGFIGPLSGTGDPAVDTLLHWYRGDYEPALQTIKGQMGLTSYLDNYIRHVFPDKLSGSGVGQPIGVRNPGSFIERTGAQGYSEDPKLALAFDRAQTMVRKETNDFVQQTLSRYGQKLKPDAPLPQDMVEYFPKGNLQFFPTTTQTGSTITGVTQATRYAVPQEIGQALNSITSPKDTLLALKLFDTVQGLWKASVTTLFPAFHVRNELGNVYQNFIAGVHDPAVYADALKLQRTGLDEQAKLAVSAAGKVVDAASPDAVLPVDQFLHTLKMRGALSSGYFGEDIATLATKLDQTDSGLAQLATKLGMTPDKAKNLQWLDYGYGMQKMGSALEDNAKLAHVLGRMAQGDGIDDAIMSAKKYLFDYGDLSDTERQLFKRVIPFYTWTRKNVPLQIEKLAQEPRQAATVAKLANMVGTDAGLTNEQKALMPQYVAERFNIAVDNNDPAHPKLITGLGLPIEDLNQLWSLNGQNTFQNLLQNATPLLKAPLEMLFGRSLFTGKDIQDASLNNYYRRVNGMIGDLPGIKQWLNVQTTQGTDRNGNPVTYYSADPMRNYLLLAAFGRLDATASKFTNEQYTPEQKVLNALTGVKVTTPDLARPLVAFDLAQQKVIDERNAKIEAVAQKVADTAPGSTDRELAMLQYRKDRGSVLQEYAIRLDQARTEAAQQQDINPQQIAAGELQRRGLLDPNQLALAQYHDFNPDNYASTRDFFAARDSYLSQLSPEQQAYITKHSNTWINDLPPTARAVEGGYQQALSSFRDYMAIQPFAVPIAADRFERMRQLEELYRSQPNPWMQAQFKSLHPDLVLYDQLRAQPNPRRRQFLIQHPEIRAYGLVGQTGLAV